jgi:4-amino-4-deoxy-L-arabinose transferase-like glycosyltransferase
MAERRSEVVARALPLLRPFEHLRVSPIILGVGAITLVGLTLRLIWALYADTIPLGGDPHWYYVVGWNLADGNGFVAARNALFEIPGPGKPTAFWPPGYPFALAAVFWLFGVGVRVAQVQNAVLGAAAIPFVYAIGARIFGRGPGLFAAGVYAVLPNAISGIPVLFPEPLFTLIFVAALWLLVSFPLSEHGRWLPLLGFGALTGMAMLTRGQGAVLLPVAALYWLQANGWRPAARATGLAIVAAAAIIAPWTARNAVELHAFIPVSTNSGAALRVGHAPDSIGTTHWTNDVIDGFRMEQSLYRPDWEVKGYREYTRLAIAYALTHPKHEVKLSQWKVYHLYRSDTDTIHWLDTLGATPLEPAWLERGLPTFLDVTYGVLLFATLASVPFWFSRRDPARLLLVNVVLVWTLFHIAFLGEPRYHVPLFPIFTIALGGGVWALAKSIGRGRGTARASADAP